MKSVLPDVCVIDIKFRDLTPHTRFEPDLADTCTFRFSNGKALEVQGVYLWKFLDAIPEELGTEEHGYFDANAYADEYAEAMMHRLRDGYQLAFAEISIKGMSRRPESARIDLVTGNVSAVWRRKLEAETLAMLSRYVLRLAEEDKTVGQRVGQLVADETSRPKFKLGYVDIGGGMLGRKPQFGPWPDLSSMAYEDFTMLLSSKTREGGPVHFTQSDLVSAIFDAASTDLLEEGVTMLRKDSPAWFADAARQLGCSAKTPRTATVLEALARSDDRFVASDAISEVWHQRLKGKTVKQVVAMATAKVEPKAKIPKRFRMVVGLWLAPDFTEVEAGLKPAPYVNHDRVNFEGLGKLLTETFRYGPPVTIRVANDTIDQVTLHMRDAAKMECKDFGQALLSKSSQTTGDVIEIRREWSQLHVMKDRTASPPPINVAFVVEASDFEDAMFWMDETSPVLGLPLMMERMTEEWSGKEAGEPQEGKLPQGLRRELEAVFGCSFLPFALLSRMACDPLPKGYGMGGIG